MEGRAMMRDVLRYLVTALVEHPEAVAIEEAQKDGGVTFTVHVHPDDMGQVIGRAGRIAKAIRSVMRAVGRREERRVTVDIR
jgi:predicted RNA-binding protein YlqC (UPF0109 family)